MILVILFIRALISGKTARKMVVLMWGIVMARLLIPFKITSRFSVFGLFRHVADRLWTLGHVRSIEGAGLEGFGVQQAAGFAVAEQAAAINPFFIIWGIGFLIAVSYFVHGCLRCYQQLRFAMPIEGDKYLDTWQEEHKIWRNIRMLQTDRIFSPITVGIVHPCIILPKDTKQDGGMSLRYMLEHEYCHIRSFDAAWKLTGILCVCLHWFNPLVWLMLFILERDLELACDETVLRRFGKNHNTDYAYTLIQMIQMQRKGLPGIGFIKNNVEERIVAIMKIKKHSIFMSMFAGAVLLVALSIFMTDSIHANPAAYDTVGSTPSAFEASDSKTDVGQEDDSQQRYREYESYGLTYDGDTYYYKNEPVAFFVDNHRGTADHFSGCVLDMGNAKGYCLEATRDEEHHLTGIIEITKERVNELAFWR